MILLFCLAAGMGVGLLIARSSEPEPNSIAISDLAQLVKQGAVTGITVHDDRATASSSDGQQYSVRFGQNADVPRVLKLFTTLPLGEIEKLAALRGAEINEA